MEKIGMFEAKTHLSALLERVARGEEIIITKHGKPVARLLPAAGNVRKDPARVAQRIRALRKGIKLPTPSLNQLIEEGRRY